MKKNRGKHENFRGSICGDIFPPMGFRSQKIVYILYIKCMYIIHGWNNIADFNAEQNNIPVNSGFQCKPTR